MEAERPVKPLSPTKYEGEIMVIGVNRDYVNEPNISDLSLARKVMSQDVIKLIEAEVKRYKRQDIILSEREIAENKKIADILESLIPKILEVV